MLFPKGTRKNEFLEGQAWFRFVIHNTDQSYKISWTQIHLFLVIEEFLFLKKIIIRKHWW